MDRKTFEERCDIINHHLFAEFVGLQAEGQAQREIASRDDLRWAYTEQVERIASEFSLRKFDMEKERHEIFSLCFAGRNAQATSAYGGMHPLDAEDFKHQDNVRVLLDEHYAMMKMGLRASRLARREGLLHLRDNVAADDQDAYTRRQIIDIDPIDSLMHTGSAFFKIFHEGNLGFLYDPDYIAEVQKTIVQPTPLIWQGLAAQVLEDSLKPVQPPQPIRSIPSGLKPEDARTADWRLRPMRQHLSAAGFEFEKFLGVGGQGLAALFKCRDVTGQTRKIVVKMLLHEPADAASNHLLKEKSNLAKMKGHMHIVQSLTLRQLRATMPIAGPRMTTILDACDHILVMEYLEHGDLYHMICKLVRLQVEFNSQLLWKIFKCLFQGCIGMASPNHGAPPPLGVTLLSEKVGNLDEAADRQADLFDKSSRALIHFDLDPQNIFIGKPSPNDDGHRDFPIFKIADFGLASIVDRDDIQSVWSNRATGKFEFLAPEQFCQEWKYIYEAPFYERARDPHNELYSTAGRYNKYQNLFQVAATMWCMITQAHLPRPKLEQQYKRDGVLLHTYGKELMSTQYDHIDLDLREVLCQCMSHNPDDRPAFTGLEALIDRKTSPGYWDLESNQRSELLLGLIFGEPYAKKRPGKQQPDPRSLNRNAGNPQQTNRPMRKSSQPEPSSHRTRNVPRKKTPRTSNLHRQSGVPAFRVTPPAKRALRAVRRAFTWDDDQPRYDPTAQLYGLNYDGQGVQAAPRKTPLAKKIKKNVARQWDKVVDKFKDF